jgi:hypothetical protein
MTSMADRRMSTALLFTALAAVVGAGIGVASLQDDPPAGRAGTERPDLHATADLPEPGSGTSAPDAAGHGPVPIDIDAGAPGVSRTGDDGDAVIPAPDGGGAPPATAPSARSTGADGEVGTGPAGPSTTAGPPSTDRPAPAPAAASTTTRRPEIPAARTPTVPAESSTTARPAPAPTPALTRPTPESTSKPDKADKPARTLPDRVQQRGGPAADGDGTESPGPRSGKGSDR